jgi:pimeloyl-ACP methyl ester carboxylesterase
LSRVESIVKHTIRRLPARQAAALVRWLASRTQRPPLTPTQSAALAQAQRLNYGPDGRHAAYAWGHGPLVLLAHGWNGHAAQMAPLALALSRHGYRCVAFDVTGHGASPGHHTRWSCLIDDGAALLRTLGAPDVHALLGHSAGGLALMAARAVHGLRARHLVCICAPSHPHPPIRAIRQRIDPPETVIDAYRHMLAQQFRTTWDRLEAGHAFAGAGEDLLLVYDRADRFVDHGDGDRILSWCLGATLVKTAAHGHTRILGAPELVDIVAQFIAGTPAPLPVQPAFQADITA